MPRRTHSTRRASFFHVVNRTANTSVLFTQPADYRAFLSVLTEAIDRHPVRLISYALMPNHWHLVVGPTDSDALSRCVHWVTATHAARLYLRHRAAGREPVYHGSFYSVEISAADRLMNICRSVEGSAVRDGLVRRAQDWPWTSLFERLNPADQTPLVNTPFLSSRAWVDFVNRPQLGEMSPLNITLRNSHAGLAR